MVSTKERQKFQWRLRVHIHILWNWKCLSIWPLTSNLHSPL